LRKSLIEPVWVVTKDGRKRKLPFALAHLQRIKERAVKGDPKADQVLIQFYKAMGLFDAKELNELVEFTLKLGPPGMTLPRDDAAPSDTSLPDQDASRTLSGRKNNDTDGNS
jgi:hypothetical protein